MFYAVDEKTQKCDCSNEVTVVLSSTFLSVVLFIRTFACNLDLI